MTTNKVVRGFDFTNVITKKHEGKWVALSVDYRTVVASNADIAKLEKEVGAKDVIYMRAVAPNLDAGYCL